MASEMVGPTAVQMAKCLAIEMVPTTELQTAHHWDGMTAANLEAAMGQLTASTMV